MTSRWRHVYWNGRKIKVFANTGGRADYQIRPEINSKFEEKNVYCEKKNILCFGVILTIWTKSCVKWSSFGLSQLKYEENCRKKILFWIF